MKRLIKWFINQLKGVKVCPKCGGNLKLLYKEDEFKLYICECGNQWRDYEIR